MSSDAPDEDVTLRVGAALGCDAPPPGHALEIRLKGREIAAIAAVPVADPPVLKRVALPAFVNAHDHGWGLRTLAFGALDRPLELWIPALSHMPPVDPYLAARVAFVRMARSGIGATVHCHNALRADQLVEDAGRVKAAAREVGLRVAFSCPIFDRNAVAYGGPEVLTPYLDPADRARLRERLPQFVPGEEQLAAIEAVAAAHEDEDFQVQIGPIGPQWCRDETLAAIAEASRRRDRRIHMHLLETEIQRRWSDSIYPEGLVRFLDGLGFLSPRLTVAHGVWLDEDDCCLLAERGVTLAVNVVSNLRLRSGLAPLARIRSAGLRYGFGLDAMSLDDGDDALRDFRLAFYLHQGEAADGLDARGFLNALSGDGAVAIDGERGGGAIATGVPADIAVFDLSRCSRDLLLDDLDPFELLMARGTRLDLDALYVAGRAVVSGGRCIGTDLAEAERELQTAAEGHACLAPEERAFTARISAALARCYTDGAHLGKAG